MQLREKRKIQKLNAKMKDKKIEVTKLRKLKIAGIKYDSKIIRIKIIRIIRIIRNKKKLRGYN